MFHGFLTAIGTRIPAWREHAISPVTFILYCIRVSVAVVFRQKQQALL
jgi:hypothetical protein